MNTSTLKPKAANATRSHKAVQDRVKPTDVSGQAIAGEWCVGIVAMGATGPVVASGNLKARARRAASCLLEPAVGDSVACLRIAPDEVWIMAVLQREEGTPNVLRCAGDTRIEVAGGGLSLQADQMQLKAGTVEVSSGRLAVTTEVAEVVGQQLSAIGTRIKLVGSVLSSVMDRIQQYSKHYLRTTDGIDRVAATHVEIEAQQLMRLEGEHALVNGRKLVKARGAQIHFG